MAASGSVSSSVPRVLTLWCPEWPVHAVPSAEGPLIVLDQHRVVAACADAREAGVRTGDRRRAALRACPNATVVPRDYLAEVQAFERVVSSVAEIIPLVELLEPGSLCFDMRGPARYFGGEDSVVEHVRSVVERQLGAGISIGIGVADGRAASAIAARRSGVSLRPVIVEPGRTAAAFITMNLRWLHAIGEMSIELVELLDRLGIRTVGDLAALSERDVLARFGLPGVRAYRVATGTDERPLSSVAPSQLPERERRFDEPVLSVTPVVFSARELASALVQELAIEGLVCTRMTVAAETEHSERTERHWYRSEGFTAAAIVDRVRWQLDAWINEPSAVSAGVIVLRISVTAVRPDDGVQEGFWGGASEADGRANRAVARLVTLCGPEGVRVPLPIGGRLPEDRYGWVSTAVVDRDHHVDALAPWPGSVVRPAPVIVPTHEVPIEVLNDRGESVGVSGRGEMTSEPVSVVIGGRSRRVVAWAGPWPLIERWWDERRRRRLARLQVVLGDGSAHLLAVEHQRWHLMGTHN